MVAPPSVVAVGATSSTKTKALMFTGNINFKAVNEAAVQSLPHLLARWLPGGKRIGKEYIALNPTRADRRPGSFKVVIVGHRAGVWADFATGDRGGDPISLAAYLFGLRQGEAARKLAEMLGVRHD
jgi:hypothetical protein